MIHTNRVVTVGDQESIIDKPIVLYRGDREVEVEFELVGNEFMFSTEGNVIKSMNASHGQLVLNTPSGDHMFSEVAECHDGKVVFVITKEMIDEFIEIGFYSFQIRLYDGADMKSRASIPPVFTGIDIRNPIAAEDETNVVDQAVVDYARIYRDQSNEELPTFTWDGVYNKTDWVHHDVITENKMNKIEDAIWTVNNKISESDNVFLKKAEDMEVQRQNDVNSLNAKDTQLTNDIQNVNRTLTNEVNKLRVDMEVGDTSVKNELTEYVEGELNFIKDVKININSLGVYGDGSDVTSRLSEIFNADFNTIYIPDGIYTINDTINIRNFPKKIIGGENTIFKVTTNTAKNLFNIYVNVSFENIVIDFDYNDCLLGLNYQKNLGEIRLKNITIKNVKSETTSATMLIRADAVGCSFYFDDIKLINNSKKDNGNTEVFEGIYLTNNHQSDVWEGGILNNIYIKDFYRYTDNGLSQEVSNAIYLAGSSPNGTCSYANITLNNIKAINFGKRLLKSQVSNVTVNGVYAESNTGTTMTAISFQDHDLIRTYNCKLENAVIKGDMEYGVAVSTDDVYINNVDIDVYNNTLSRGVSLGGDNITIVNSKICAPTCLMNSRAVGWADRGPVRNVVVDNCILKNKKNSTYLINFEYSNLEPIHGLQITNTTFDIRTASCYAIFAHPKNSGNIMKDFILRNIYVVIDSTDKGNNQLITFNQTHNIVIDGVTVIDEGSQGVYRHFAINNCERVKMSNLYLSPKASNTCISFSTNVDVIVENMFANESSLYFIGLTNTNSILNVNDNIRKKLAINDNFSQQNRKIINQMTVCRNTLRPTDPIQGDMCYDTTLNKPIWWNGNAWIDATGTQV